MRADLKSDAKALEQQLSGGKSSGQSFSAAHFSLRAYRVENAALAGSSLAALEERYAGERLSVHRVQRDGELLTLEPTLALKRGDRLVVSALRGAFLHAERDIGPEIDDADAAVGAGADGVGRRDERRRERQRRSRRWRRTRTRAASTSNRSSAAPS